MASLTTDITSSRITGRLHIAPGIGLTSVAMASTPVRANTFFGAA